MPGRPRAVRIGIDVTPLAATLTGVGRYTLELLRALHGQAPDVELTLLTHAAVDDALRDTNLGSLSNIRGSGAMRRSLWLHTALPIHLARSGIDLCHYINYQAPIVGRTPYVITMHDLSLRLDPESHPRSRIYGLGPLLGTLARRSRGVICPSHSVAAEVVEVLGVSQDRVHVVPEAAAEVFKPTDPQVALSTARKFGLAPGYLLNVGTIEPRKNLLRLVSAYGRLRATGFDQPLVICGRWGWKSGDLRPRIGELGLTDHVRVIGFVTDDDLVDLLNAAVALVYPSLYEGFGLPILEAMACGTPVVTSNRGAMAEVAGECALLVDPEDVESMASGLERITGDGELRTGLASAGMERARGFSWAATARSTVAVYRSALGRAAE